MQNSVLSIKNMNKFFDKTHILKDINLELESNQIITILGKSGCGKTTLLRIIAGLENTTNGEVITKTKVSLMFQNYALMPHLNVFKNIELALLRLPKSERKARIDELLSNFFIDKIANSKIDEISGGQAQRVAFARAVADKAGILLLDEPFSNLDSELKFTLRRELKKLIKSSGISAILVTHDKEDAFAMSDKIALIDDGHIIAFDDPKKLFRYPKNAKIASFLGEINSIENLQSVQNPDFKAELEKRNFMFRPHDIIRGNKYIAKILNSEYLGAVQRFELEFEGVEFNALIYDEYENCNEFGFDFKYFKR